MIATKMSLDCEFNGINLYLKKNHQLRILYHLHFFRFYQALLQQLSYQHRIFVLQFVLRDLPALLLLVPQISSSNYEVFRILSKYGQSHFFEMVVCQTRTTQLSRDFIAIINIIAIRISLTVPLNHFYSIDAGGSFPMRQLCSLSTIQIRPVPQIHGNELQLQVLRMMGFNIQSYY